MMHLEIYNAGNIYSGMRTGVFIDSVAQQYCMYGEKIGSILLDIGYMMFSTLRKSTGSG